MKILHRFFRRFPTGIGGYLCLPALLFLTFWIRIQGVPQIPEGQFTETDAYFYYWQAQLISEHGQLPERDMHRWMPIGRDLEQLLSLYPYMIVYAHKILAFFLPHLTLYDVQLYAPTIFFTLGVCALYLFLADTRGFLFANTVALILATLPGSIERSAAGFSDRDAFVWFLAVLTITTYLWKEQTDIRWRRLLLTTLSGGSAFLGGLSWEGFGAFICLIIFAELWKFINSDREEALSEFLLWTTMFVPWLYLASDAYRNGYGFSKYVTTLMLVPPLIIIGLRSGKWILLKYIERLRPYARTTAIIFVHLSLIAVSCYLFSQREHLNLSVIHFSHNRLMQIVGELKTPNFSYWMFRYGAIFITGSVGLIVSYFKWWKGKLSTLTGSLLIGLFVFSIFFQSFLHNRIGENASNTLFLIASILLVIELLSLRKQTIEHGDLTTITLTAWFLLWVGLAHNAKRHDFFIGVPLAFFTALLIREILPSLTQKLKHVQFLNAKVHERKLATCFTIILFLPFLFWNPLGGHVNRSVHAAMHLRKPLPFPNSMADMLKWMQTTLSQDAVLAGEWTYGSQLNVLGGVKTITDQDHYIQHWIHLYYRHVFCGQSEREALEFLKTHGATHLMLTEWDLRAGSVDFSTVGSDANFDRRFQFHRMHSVEMPLGAPHRMEIHDRNTKIALTSIELDVTLPKQVSVTALFTPDNKGSRAPLNDPMKSKIVTQANFDNTTRHIAVDLGNGGVVLYFNEHKHLKNAYYIPPIGWNSLAVKLFMRQEYSKAFVPVYPTDGSTTDVKVWEIHYPPDIKTDPKYLKTGFPEIDKTLGLP